MLIGIPAETTARETRVALTPETAKKLKAQGHTLRVQSGAGVAASVTDAAFEAAGAEITDAAGALGCDLVLKVRSPSEAELAMMKSGARLVGMLNPFDARRPATPGQRRPDQLCAGSGAAHHPRPEHGRVVVAGQHRRLQGGDDGRRQVPALLPDADDRGRHRQGGAGRDPGRRRGRPAGDCHRQAPGRGDRGLGRAPQRQGAGRVAGRQVHRGVVRHRRREGSRGRRRRLCQADAAELARPAEDRGRQTRGAWPTW